MQLPKVSHSVIQSNMQVSEDRLRIHIFCKRINLSYPTCYLFYGCSVSPHTAKSLNKLVCMNTAAKATSRLCLHFVCRVILKEFDMARKFVKTQKRGKVQKNANFLAQNRHFPHFSRILAVCVICSTLPLCRSMQNGRHCTLSSQIRQKCVAVVDVQDLDLQSHECLFVSKTFSRISSSFFFAWFLRFVCPSFFCMGNWHLTHCFDVASSPCLQISALHLCDLPLLSFYALVAIFMSFESRGPW